MPRQRYRERIPLPDDVDLEAVKVTRAFIHKTVRLNCSLFRRTFRVNCEQVEVDTGDSLIEDSSLTRALARLQPTDVVDSVKFVISTGRNDEAVGLVWSRRGDSYAEVAGTRQIWVLGVSGALDRFLRHEGYRHPDPKPARWRLLGLPRDIATDALGMVVGSGLLALIGLVLAVVTR